MRLRSVRGLLCLPILLLLGATILLGDLKQGEDLLIQRKYTEAAAALAAVAGDLPVELRARGVFLLGHAKLLAGDPKGAIEAFRRVQADHAGAPEVAASRFLEAKARERSGAMQEAAQIYREEIERLVGLSRKEEVAATYLGLAEKALAAEPPRHADAATFFDLALDLGLPPAKARTVRLQAAEALLAASNPGEAIPRLRGLLRDLEVGAHKPRAMLALGRALRMSGDPAGCRAVLRDLRALGHDGPDSPEAAEAAYEVALSYGVPQPVPSQLDRAVLALRDLQQNHPDHSKAKIVEFLIARCQAHCGRAELALAALASFLSGHGDSGLPEIATARAMVGDVLLSQQKLGPAIAAYQDYLRLHPAHADWERVQRAIVDAEFGLAVLAQEQGKASFAAARDLYEAFASKYPLDARNPDILNRISDMLLAEEQYDAAREAFARCVAKYPGKEASSRAQFEIGRIHEQHKFDFEAALAGYKAVVGPWQARAQAAIQRLTEKRLELLTKRTFRSDEEAVFELSSRNIEKVRVRVYRLALEDYFRATHTTGDIGRLDIEIIAPDQTFDSQVPDYVRHRETARQVAIGFREPGAYVVKVDDQELEATTMVLVTDLALIAKSNRHEFFVFTQDQKQQRARGGVKVVLSDGEKVLSEGVTGVDGVYRWQGPELQQRDRLSVFAVDAGGSGASSLPLSGLGYSPGLEPRGYLYTDRPLYQPGQHVNLKGIVREVKGGLYCLPQGTDYRVRVTRPNGRPALDEAVAFTAFGTLATAIDLPADADLGTWSICVHSTSRVECTFHGSFEVGHYERPRLALAIELGETVVYRGEPIRGRAVVKHFYGEPAVGKQVAVVLRLPDGAELRSTGATNAAGELPFTFATTEFAEEAMAMVRAEIEGENVATAVPVPVVTTELLATVSTVRPVYLTGESLAAEVKIEDRSGKPMARQATVVLSRLESARGAAKGVAEIEVARAQVTTTADGKGQGMLRADKGGEHRLRIEVLDRFGTLVTGDAQVSISGDDDSQKIRLLGDRDTYRTGETAVLKVANRAGSKLALLTWQGDGILAYETRILPAGESKLELPIASMHAPNFALAMAIIDGDKLHTAQREFHVERDLRLSLTLPATARPGEEVEVAVVARDAEGKPVATELSLALIDEALLAVATSATPAIGPFFHGRSRETVFATASSCTWSYRGPSRRISGDLLAEERRALRELPERARQEMSGDQQLVMAVAQTATAAEPQSDVSSAVRRFAARDEGTQPSLFAGNQMQNAALPMGGLLSFADSKRSTLLFDSSDSVSLGLATDRPRTDFRETGAWISTLVTGVDGRATARITLPHSTTSWRLLGKGVTVDTQVGEATAALATKQDLQVDLIGPPLLVEGDESELRFTAHNLTDTLRDLKLAWQVTGAMTGTGSNEQPLAAHAELEYAFRVLAGEAAQLALELKGQAGGQSDEVHRLIPVLPFGVEMQDGKSGSTRDRASFALGLPEGREYTGLELAIEIGPDPGRDLIAAALGLGFQPQNCRFTKATNLAQASRGIAVLLALAHVEQAGGASKVDLDRLRAVAQALVATTVGRQRTDGSFAWVLQQTEDLRSTCQAVRFLAMARARGLSGTEQALDTAAEWLLTKLRAAATEPRADLVWALAACGKLRFESLNSLQRVRNSLSIDGLSRLALACHDFGRAEAAVEVLEVLRNQLSPMQLAELPVETVALATAALLRSDRRDVAGTKGLEFLNAARLGAGWSTAEATAAAILAITQAERTGAGAPRATVVAVSCNGVALTAVPDEGTSMTQRFRVAAANTKQQGNRIDVRVEGGGEVHYRAHLTGFGRGFLPGDRNNSRVRLQRNYLAAARRHDGKEVPSGFSCIEGTNIKSFENQITQLRVGENCRVRLSFSLRQERDYGTVTPLIVEEPIPAGCSVPRDSIQGGFDHVEVQAGRLVFFFREGVSSAWITYDLQARFPGTYRVPSTRVQSALRPEFTAYGEPGRLLVHPRGDAAADTYQLTPDELLHLGTASFDEAAHATGQPRTALLQEAWNHLTALLAGWHKQEHHLRDDHFKEVARMMLFLGIERSDARAVVRYFEELKDRYADLVIPFDKIVAVGNSYLDLGEFEAALMVFRATADASFLKDAAVASVLQQHGESRAATQFLARLLATYPDLATMRVARYSIGQKLAAQAAAIPAEAAVDDRVGSPAELRQRALAALREFLVLHPDDALADEVSFAWATTHVEDKDLAKALAVTEAALQRYPGSPFTDEFLYASGYAQFVLGHHDPAFAALRRVAEEQFPLPNGGTGASESQWHAVYLQGQIHHARGESEQALAAYDRVVDRFGDAAEAADYFRQQQLALPEVTTFKLAAAAEFTVSYRNLTKASVQVFKVDLMRLYVMERSLSDIRGIQLHGIRPQLAFEVELGSGRDYRMQEKKVQLDLREPGAYLVVLRSGNQLASGMVLRSDIQLEAQEQFDAGRIRINCKQGDAFLANAHVKIGSAGNPRIQSGDSDLRGVLAGDDLVGPATVIVQKGEQYAFYRGTGLHQPQRFAPVQPGQQPRFLEQLEKSKDVHFDALENNLHYNVDNRSRQVDWLDKNVLNKQQKGVEVYRTK